MKSDTTRPQKYEALFCSPKILAGTFLRRISPPILGQNSIENAALSFKTSMCRHCHAQWPILRYYRCDTPCRTILFQGGEHSPKMVRCAAFVLSFTQAHLCDTPFCNISCDICAIPHKKKHARILHDYRHKYRPI